MAIGLCFKNKKTLKLPVPKIQTVVLAILGSNLLLKFHNNFAAEFRPTLFQRFFWNFSSIFIISIKADTRNFSQKYQQFSLLEAIFFEQWGPFKRYKFPKIKFTINEILHSELCNLGLKFLTSVVSLSMTNGILFRWQHSQKRCWFNSYWIQLSYHLKNYGHLGGCYPPRPRSP